MSKQDIRVYCTDVPFSIACKDPAALAVREWFRQTAAAASTKDPGANASCSAQMSKRWLRPVYRPARRFEMRGLRAQSGEIRIPLRPRATLDAATHRKVDGPVGRQGAYGARVTSECLTTDDEATTTIWAARSAVATGRP